MATITASRTEILSTLHEQIRTEMQVDDLSPDQFGKRVVIRSANGSVCGVLLYTHPHPSLIHFTCVKLVGKIVLTFRSDLDTVVVE